MVCRCSLFDSLCCYLIMERVRPGFVFFFNDTATTEIYTLSLHDALPISILNELAGRLGIADAFWSSAQDALDFKLAPIGWRWRDLVERAYRPNEARYFKYRAGGFGTRSRSEEHTSELQSRQYLVCRLLLE